MSKVHPARKKSLLRKAKANSRHSSAQKPVKKAVSPQSNKVFAGKQGNLVIYGRAVNYRGIFERMQNDFRQRVTALRSEYRDAARKHSAAGISGSGWTADKKKAQVTKAIHGSPSSNNYFSAELGTGSAFVETFLEAISDSAFPHRPKAQARFLAESIAGYGEVSARRCRDICSYLRREEKRKKVSHPELRIKCCGKARWTVNSICPECGESPIPISVIT